MDEISSWLAEIVPSTKIRQAAPASPMYDNDIRCFLEVQGGTLMILSDDTLFIKTMRTGVLRTLQIARDCVESFRDAEAALRGIRSRAQTNGPMLVMTERLLAGKPTLDFVRSVKQLYPQQKVILLTYETTKEALSLLFEIGVDHVLTKPVSVDMIIEKMASVIKPQTKLSQLVQDARMHLDLGEYDKVFKVCDAILGMKQDSAIAFMLRGEAFMRGGNETEAVDEFEKAHQSSPLYLEPLKKLADVHREGNQDQFLNYMLQLDNISPLNVDRKCEIGKCYARKQSPDLAKEYFDKAIACAQEEAKRYLCSLLADMANAVLETSPELSEKYYSQYFEVKGTDLSKDDIVVFNSRGMAMRKQGKWREALENYETALKIAPDDLRLLYNYALAYADGEQHRKAVDIYEKILHGDQEFHLQAPVVSYNIANSYYHLKDIKAAKKFVEAALALDPGHASSCKLQARLG
ncbi:MAG: tetratricopeptide repeat protein [Proteobacteria bacterium]|nr:tetratricopeptide repeat protein [Pseudomonadota bacterium]